MYFIFGVTDIKYLKSTMPATVDQRFFITEKNGLIISTRCIWLNLAEFLIIIRTRNFVTRPFGKLYYKDLFNIFQLDLQNFLLYSLNIRNVTRILVNAGESWRFYPGGFVQIRASRASRANTYNVYCFVLYIA